MGIKAYKAGSTAPAATPAPKSAKKADSAPAAIARELEVAALPRTVGCPTTEQFSAYQAAFDYFNRTLFSGQLGGVILNFSRKAKSLGFFAPLRWGKERVIGHEISLNPSYLAYRPMRDTMSTLAHEMAHLWQ